MKSRPYRILFLRHGETAYNAEARLQGQRDIPLNARGRDQAAAVGRMLRDRFGPEVARLDRDGAFFASPLVRARDTMDIVRAEMNLPPGHYTIADALKELSFGAWEGLTWPEVEARDPAAVAARHADKWRFQPPGGESYAMLAGRLRPWLAAQGGDRFLVSHGGVARAFMTILAGAPGEKAADASIWQGRALIFEGGGYSWAG